MARPKAKVFGDLRDELQRSLARRAALDLTKPFEPRCTPASTSSRPSTAGNWSTWVYDIREGDPTFFSAVGLEEMVAGRGAPQDGVGQLNKKAREAGVETLYVVRLGDDGKPLKVWSYTPRQTSGSLSLCHGEITRTAVETGDVKLTLERRTAKRSCAS